MSITHVRSRAALVAFALACAALPAGAQDSAKPQVDPEEEALRKAAESESDKDPKKGPGAAPLPGIDEESRLRSDAVRASQDDDRGQGLLNQAFSSVANSLSAFNPRMSVVGDLLGRLATNKKRTVELDEDGNKFSPDDRVSLREAEVDLRADVDPYAKAVVILSAAEEGPGKFGIDIEEAYVTFETLPGSLKLKAGRFLVPFGRMNSMHTHDLPQSVRPYALQDLFGEEGWKDNGAVVSWLAPIPIELSAAVVNGETDLLFKGRSNRPAFVERVEGFIQVTDTAFLSLGASHLFGFTDLNGSVERPRRSHLEVNAGCLDMLFKWQPNRNRSFVIGSELYRVFTREHEAQVAIVDPITGISTPGTQITNDTATGFYAFAQFQATPQWYFGARYDWSNYDQQIRGEDQWAASAWVSFYTTEFLRLRLGYEHRERGTTGNAAHASPNDTVFFELTFVFGAHPAEPFWVNK
jgi:hypothetical protein